MADTVVFPTHWGDMGTRKTSFGGLFMFLLEKKGYTNPRGLGVRGAYAFEVTGPDGSKRKIGIKTAHDRWLNTAEVMVGKVDEVWVMTFKWEDDEPSEFEVYSIPAADLTAIYANIHAQRKRLRKTGVMTYLPLDQAGVDKYAGQYFVSCGALTKHMKLIYTAPLLFSDRNSPRIESTADTQSASKALAEPLQGKDELIAALKAIHARDCNTSPDKVRLQLLVEA